MDGASYWQVFRKLMLPLSIPAITRSPCSSSSRSGTTSSSACSFSTTRRSAPSRWACGDPDRPRGQRPRPDGRFAALGLPAVVVYLIFQRNLIQA